MKRRRSQSTTDDSSQKALCRTAVGGERRPCALERTIAEYAILESLMSHLFPNDMYSLAGTSKAVYSAIFHSPESKSTLLGKMKCDGSGIRVRNRHHRKSVYYAKFNCTERAICGANDNGKTAESHPCVECNATTCNECRIHCVYQSIIEPPDEPDELPNYSGFVLLDDKEMGILSPAHLGFEGSTPWLFPHHDQGHLDIPLESDKWAAPEPIDRILDLDLGQQVFPPPDSHIPHPSPIIQVFWDINKSRRRTFCMECFEKQQSNKSRHGSICQCSFRTHFLDRWLCLRCYEREVKAINSFTGGASEIDASQCSCGQRMEGKPSRILCLWCRGEVSAFASPP